MQNHTKLGLGGHSFIAALGSDPEASFEEQCAIVAACLDSGACWIDTTYYQERVALGNVLRQIGRRDEARIAAWNFFRTPGDESALPGPTAYSEDSLTIQLDELQTNYLDLLVIHRTDDDASLLRQIELAQGWRSAGLIREVGLGMARREDLARLPTDHPITQVLSPYNAFNPGAASLFREAKTRGIKSVAMSPFVRGWNLQNIDADKQAAAALLLRWVTSREFVDTIFVSMRRATWVRVNREAEGQGALTESEQARVKAWVATVR